MSIPSSARKSKASLGAEALARATSLALAEVTPPPTPPTATPSPVTNHSVSVIADKEGGLVRATITLREEDLAMLDLIEDYLRRHNRRTSLPRAMLIQVAIRSVQIGPALSEIAQAVRAQDARGKKKVVAS